MKILYKSHYFIEGWIIICHNIFLSLRRPWNKTSASGVRQRTCKVRTLFHLFYINLFLYRLLYMACSTNSNHVSHSFNMFFCRKIIRCLAMYQKLSQIQSIVYLSLNLYFQNHLSLSKRQRAIKGKKHS